MKEYTTDSIFDLPNSDLMINRGLMTNPITFRCVTTSFIVNGVNVASGIQFPSPGSFPIRDFVAVTATNLSPPQMMTASDSGGTLILQVNDGPGGPDDQSRTSPNLLNSSAVFTTNPHARPLVWTNSPTGLPLNFFGSKSGLPLP